MERLKSARKKTVGTKQTQKAVEKGQARVVYVAKDAEARVASPLLQLCAEKNVEVVMFDSMEELGKACGIKVGAASAAVIE
ncbi:MAG: ribosomal L7Ae/L30e/S12e/Gadd45 family protein [Bacillota bacterium]|jgi:large subunit ribosomal protein L7A|nr:ribosomal L7Ae/L30e/S12e/Gadd45 family protein [Bacillota bacterium]